MKVLVTGATGFIGTPLVKALREKGHEVLALTRTPSKIESIFGQGVAPCTFSKTTGLIDSDQIKDVEAVINLMGENISGGRWSEERKSRIRDSRIKGTRAVVESFKDQPGQALKCFINASAIGIYPTNTERELEESSPLGEGFLAEVCKEWENAAAKIKELHPETRLAITRFGVVLGKGGGALDKMLTPFKFGVGGKIGDGSQVMSWIHIEDLISILVKCLEDERYVGVFNATAPKPITNSEFTKALGRALHRPTPFPVPPFALKAMFGEMSSIILDSQKVLPKHLENLGHDFKYKDINEALGSIVKH